MKADEERLKKQLGNAKRAREEAERLHQVSVYVQINSYIIL